ncbi:ATP-binding cassette domain-containing protein, partial [Paucilactobacillus nenjiangensis]
MAEQLLAVNHLSKNYGEKQALKDINFTVDKGSVTVLLGPSGSGKSTLIRTLNGLEDFQAGQIEFDGQV